jgi:hypothetical protein
MMDSVQNVGHNYDHTSLSKFLNLNEAECYQLKHGILFFILLKSLNTTTDHNNIMYRDRKADRHTD